MAFVGNMPILQQQRHRQLLRELTLKRRHLRDIGNPFEIIDGHFQTLFRLDKQTVHALVERLGPITCTFAGK